MATKTDPITRTQEQMFELYQQSQAIFLSGVEAWTKAARDMTEATTSMVDTAAFEVAIDQTFDGAMKALQQQKDFLKQLRAASSTATSG